ncbi:golgin subfamily A member 6-like protein 1 [Lates japonicus]|uniref:Golgin subfamily A member 6-like protein 1 n=1 Tax=Lates japonicus TaxID=270547 RepID=A0AAD3N7Y3_LATJO|nr:golgin subfamily A member 6-like protein 1 [Lates japonicus]
MWHLEHKKEKIVKALIRTCDKEKSIEAGDDTPEMKDIRVWRQLAKKRKLLKKRQTIEDRIKHKKEKQRQRQKWTKKERERRDGKGARRWEKKGEEEDTESEESEREEEEDTERSGSVPKKSLMSNLKTWYLKQQKEKIVKAISKTCDKEVAIDAGDDTLEMKEIRVWRQQAKRKTLLKKQQELEEKIQHSGLANSRHQSQLVPAPHSQSVAWPAPAVLQSRGITFAAFGILWRPTFTAAPLLSFLGGPTIAAGLWWGPPFPHHLPGCQVSEPSSLAPPLGSPVSK